MNSRNLTMALSLIAAAIGTEHFFTFSLSSLPTTKEFFAGDEAKIRDVRHAYAIATGLSLAFAVFVSILLGDPTALVVSAILCGIFIYLYERALRGEI